MNRRGLNLESEELDCVTIKKRAGREAEKKGGRKKGRQEGREAGRKEGTSKLRHINDEVKTKCVETLGHNKEGDFCQITDQGHNHEREGIYKTVQSHEGKGLRLGIDKTPVQGPEGGGALMRHLSRVPRGEGH